ncbi:transcription factor MYB124-like [Aristolochia californica]|uniref:transcription factor MYB124-like n=1 Tax=Aristolochia californica TaxID=171875 RepID=UPI0035E2E556
MEENRESKAMKLNEAPKQKDRHIVTWTPQEDDILREQISILGTESWTAIASKFKDKTSRQCRRRWYTYLSTECKKGGWSPEEDMLLCEAQKMFGNRWTEIAKVVSGRTDNAVKNRFTTLCKKRAKLEALSKENSSLYINHNNKRAILRDGISESTKPPKKIRTHIVEQTEQFGIKERLQGECGTGTQLLRPPLVVLVQNFSNTEKLRSQPHINNDNDAAQAVVVSKKLQGTFLRKDDPKIMALMQQEELLSSLALRVNTDNSNQSLENAWKELQDFLIQTEESELWRTKIAEMDILLDDFKDLIEEFKGGSPGSRLLWRQPDLQEESQGSSEYSTYSTNQSHEGDDKIETNQADQCSVDYSMKNGTEKSGVEDCDGHQNQFSTKTCVTEATVQPSEEAIDSHRTAPVLPTREYSSPVQMIPPFQSFKEGIPSPKFSDSERQYLLRTLGLASPSATSNSPCQPPSCRRALLHSL